MSDNEKLIAFIKTLTEEELKQVEAILLEMLAEYEEPFQNPFRESSSQAQ